MSPAIQPLVARFRRLQLENPILRRALDECGTLVDAVLQGVRAGKLTSPAALGLLESSFSSRGGVELLTQTATRPVRAAFRLMVWEVARSSPAAVTPATPVLNPPQHAELQLAHRFAARLMAIYVQRAAQLSGEAAVRLCGSAACLVPRAADVSAMGELKPLHDHLENLPVDSVENLDLLTGELEMAVKGHGAEALILDTPCSATLAGFHARVSKVLDAVLAERLSLSPGELSAMLMQGRNLLEYELSAEHPLARLAEREYRWATTLGPAKTLSSAAILEGVERLRTALDLFFPDARPSSH